MSDPDVVLRLKKKKNDFVNVILYASKAAFPTKWAAGNRRMHTSQKSDLYPTTKLLRMVSMTYKYWEDS